MAIYVHGDIPTYPDMPFCSIPEGVCMTIYVHIDKPITEFGYDFLCLLQINKPSTKPEDNYEIPEGSFEIQDSKFEMQYLKFDILINHWNES